MPAAVDVLVCLCAIVVPGIVFGGMFVDAMGGKMSPSVWFGWHPVFMSMAFPGLMALGRWSYNLDPSWGLGKPVLRQVHRAAMILAILAALIGYLAIFKSHYPMRMLFGYDFNHGVWKEWKRVAHSWLGYAAVLLALFQGATGSLKLMALQQHGERTLKFHGKLGKAVIVLGAACMLLAIAFWGLWGTPLKAAIGLPVCMIGLASVAYSRPEDAAESEESEEVSKLSGVE
uniref:Cytochrome b561 domain-containing protein n=1 Tax=Pyrodinium bahamense TaxID=73915 RepID=A0A7R9ZYZ9_9DINO|mmetsp:Transcript_15547/g.42957  ORF Transcript_15547/g.42957 Transcript_15547/m.42957 type:complete len:230 (+) Transcript_15547:55-744(+)|eukprot:CAMPEP_0179167582 /NCGR_PEP_ID=MMETSP0796-20121207/82397_1 /TAXON_ID=73915 /ORGANISM="Pyrodinium bahamense, Strain pbaha01" /LENGTH=229 /DNA_ID=CAMNT_0020870283 /DNA_START=55 /DNA_END=744 /DNA_ORIENTATION=+